MQALESKIQVRGRNYPCIQRKQRINTKYIKYLKKQHSIVHEMGKIRKITFHRQLQEVGYLKPGEQHCLQSDSTSSRAAKLLNASILWVDNTTTTLRF